MGLNHFEEASRALDSFEFEERRGDALVTKEAIGVSGLVTPWNFPTNQTSLKCRILPGSPSSSKTFRRNTICCYFSKYLIK